MFYVCFVPSSIFSIFIVSPSEKRKIIPISFLIQLTFKSCVLQINPIFKSTNHIHISLQINKCFSSRLSINVRVEVANRYVCVLCAGNDSLLNDWNLFVSIWRPCGRPLSVYWGKQVCPVKGLFPLTTCNDNLFLFRTQGEKWGVKSDHKTEGTEEWSGDGKEEELAEIDIHSNWLYLKMNIDWKLINKKQ